MPKIGQKMLEKEITPMAVLPFLIILIVHLRIIFAICTIASFQALKFIDNDVTVYIEQISENILKKIVQDKNIDVNSASNIFFSSKIFASIANKKHEYKEEDWQDIYKKLKEELGNH